MNAFYYDIADRGAAIKEIKKYLYLISENLYPQIPKTTIDEFFDEETKKAIREYQSIKEIETSGTVDYQTFDLLYADYKALENDINTVDYILSAGFPLIEGDVSEDVRVIHLIINELSKTFENIPSLKNGNYYSSETSEAVRALRKLFDMEADSCVDKLLYLRMLREVHARKLASDY